MASKSSSFISSLLIHAAILAVLWIGFLLLSMKPDPKPKTEEAQSISLTQYIQPQPVVETVPQPITPVQPPQQKPKPEPKPEPKPKPKEVTRPIAKPDIKKIPEPIPEPEPVPEPIVIEPEPVNVEPEPVVIEPQPPQLPPQPPIEAQPVAIEPVIKEQPAVTEPAVAATPQPVVTGPSGADIRAFGNSQLRPHIEARKDYPRMAKKKKIEGKVRVKFDLHKDGHATNIRVSKSSGSALLDEAAIAAVQKASASFPPMPANFGEKQPFEITVGFEL